MLYRGSCHCGRTTFEVEGELEQLMECNCSHCTRKGLLLWFVQRDKLRLKTPEADLAKYYFNKHVIEHRFCPSCGVQPMAFGKDRQGGDIACINVRCLEGVDLSRLAVQKFDGRSL